MNLLDKYKENINSMIYAYSFGYTNERIVIEEILESDLDNTKLLLLNDIIFDMWFNLPDGIFNIFNPKAVGFLDFCESLSEYMHKDKELENLG